MEEIYGGSECQTPALKYGVQHYETLFSSLISLQRRSFLYNKESRALGERYDSNESLCQTVQVQVGRTMSPPIT